MIFLKRKYLIFILFYEKSSIFKSATISCLKFPKHFTGYEYIISFSTPYYLNILYIPFTH